MSKPLLLHVFLWIGLSALYLYFSDEIAKVIFPDEAEGFGWLLSLGGGLVLIFVVVLVSYLAFAGGKKRSRRR